MTPRQQDYEKRARKTTVIYIKGVPLELKRQFKAWCERRGTNMKEQILKMMHERAQEEVAGDGH
jgi:phage terminase Nu1 subunit (DNA packaging protein)